MGGTESSAQNHVDEAALVSAKGCQRQKMLHELAERHQEVDETDFYELFGLERYADMNDKTVKAMRSEFRRLALKWHPDKNPSSKREECNVWTAKICLAKHVLEDPDLKRRYDIELRRQHDEEEEWSAFGWWASWGWNVAATAGGLAMVITGAMATGLTGGASLGLSIAGSSLLTSGIKGSFSMWQDPECSTTEFIKDATVGALQGAAGGAICGVGMGAAMEGAAIGGRIAIAAGFGAATTTSGQLISDTTDLAITEGVLGKHVKDNVVKAKTRDEVFSKQNAGQLLRGAVLGAAVGGTIQGVSEGWKAVATAEVAEDACSAANAAVLKGRLNQVGKIVGAKVAKKSVTEAANHIVGGVSASINDALEESLFERVRKLNPDVAHRLVDDASEADFMLSRTNLQKDFADKKAVGVLEDGFTLCADNSLQSGWGGPGWVRKYVEDAKKTRFGILVLEGGPGFFESSPCCDELFAAKKASVNLTKLNGQSIRGGQYLWVDICSDIFDDDASYEKAMRQKHGRRYTPTHYKATLGPHYEKKLAGTSYTYYCVVPTGRAARNTGADQQYYPELENCTRRDDGSPPPPRCAH